MFLGNAVHNLFQISLLFDRNGSRNWKLSIQLHKEFKLSCSVIHYIEHEVKLYDIDFVKFKQNIAF